jgi:hypothetical protein
MAHPADSLAQHCAAGRELPQTLSRSIALLVENCRRLKEGEALLNQV